MKSTKNNGIFDLIDNLLPSMERTSLIAEIDRVFRDMEEVVLPGLDIPDSIIDKTKTHDQIFNKLNRHSDKFKGNVTRYLRELTDKTIAGKGDLVTLIEKSFGRKIVKEGLDYKRGHILHLISMLDFYNRYTIQLLLVTTKQALDDKYYPVDKRELEFVSDNGNMEMYAVLCAALDHEFKNMGKLMRRVDGISLSKESRETSESVLGSESDPLQTGFYTVDFNPLYLIGKMANQLYVFWFDIKREQARKLDLHIIKLKQRREGASDETLEGLDKTIEYHSNRLNVLNAEIKEVYDDAIEV